jgi:KUP system potassium uptake protein
MEEPNIPKVLASIADPEIAIDPQTTTFFLGRQTIGQATRRRAGMALWRERLFSRISLNATTATASLCIPPDRVVELGEQIEI